MRKRRGRGEGSIYYSVERKLWIAMLTVGHDPNGRRKRRALYARSKSALVERIICLQQDLRSGLPVDLPKEKVGQFLTRWLEDAARPSVRPNTYRLYKSLIERHIAPRIGGVRLAQLTPANVKGLLSELEREGVSPRLRQLVYAVLHRALTVALKWGAVPRNVADACTPPRVPRREMQVWTAAQVNTFLHAAQTDRLYAAYVVSLSCGLRQGECFGLAWEDLDLKTGTLQVRRQLSDNNGHPLLLEPKTAQARRRVELPSVAIEALKEHRAKMFAEGHLRNPLGLVFVDTHGHPLRPSNVIRNSFRPLIEKAQKIDKSLPRLRWHDMRHTAATLRLLQGDHPRVVQELLGHRDIELTLGTYSHVLPGMQQESAAKVDALFQSHRSAPR